MESLNVSKDGWVNRLAVSSGSLATSITPLLAAVSASTTSATGTTTSFSPLDSSQTAQQQQHQAQQPPQNQHLHLHQQQPPNWRLTRAILKNGVLSLYKAPSDLQIRSFDPSLVDHDSDRISIAPGAAPRNANPVWRQRALSTASIDRFATSPAAPAAATVQYRGFDPHPDLEYDQETGAIIGASDEALCHTILFGTDKEFAKQAVLALPLMCDIIVALALLKDYLSGSVQTLRTTSALKSHITTAFIVERAKLIIDIIITNYSGMVLENRIHSSMQQLADAVSSFDDTTATNLKMTIFQQHQAIHDLVNFNKDDNDTFSWSVQQKGDLHKTERLKTFLSNLDHAPQSDSVDPKNNIYSLITPEIFGDIMSSDDFAHQISYFHLKFYQNWSPAIDTSLLFKQRPQFYQRFNPLVFDFNDMHFLGRLIVHHIFQCKLDAPGRARALSHWINLGNTLKGYGDIVGWLAIALIICSIPVLRLRDTWSYTPKDLRDCVIKDWGFEIFEVEKRSKIDVLGKKTFRVSTEEMGESYPKERAVPYFGDLFVRNTNENAGDNHDTTAEIGNPAKSSHQNSVLKLSFDRIKRMNTVLNGWKYYFDQVPQNDTFGPGPQPVMVFQKMLYSMLKCNAKLNSLGTQDILEMSLKVEPAISGSFLKYHYSQPSPLNTGGFLPLIFTDTNPSYKLFARPSLIAASGILTNHPKKVARSFRAPSESAASIQSGTSYGSTSTGSQVTSTNSYENNNSVSSSGFSRHLRRNPFGGNAKSNNIASSASSIPNGPSSVPSGSNFGNGSTSSLNTMIATSSSIGPGTSSSGSTALSAGLHRSNSFPPTNGPGQFAFTTGIKDVDISSRQFISRYESHNLFMKTIRDVLNVGTTLFNVKDDIVLKAFDDDMTTQNTAVPGSAGSSRPSSVIETPSKRLSGHSARRVSTQLTGASSRGTDMNAIAAAFERVKVSKGDVHQSATNVNVVVKAANLERLVDILVLGVDEFGSFISLKDLENVKNTGERPQSLSGLLKRPHFRIDMNIHTLTFFATFRSFCSPLDLLSSLRRRFMGAGSAALSIVELDRKQQVQDELLLQEGRNSVVFVDDEYESNRAKGEKPTTDNNYPNWEPMSFIDSDNSIAWRIVAQIQIGVLEACHLWVSQYFGDFMNDLKLREEFLDLIKLFGSEIHYWKEISVTGKDPQGTSVSINEDYRSYLESMETLYKKVRNLFVKKSYRPNDIPALIPASPVGTKAEAMMVGHNDSTNLRIEKWIDDVDLIVRELYNMIQLRDWLEVFEVLELQGAEQGGFFSYHMPTQFTEDDIVIQDIFGYFDTLTRKNGSKDDLLLKSMPQSVQELFRLHNNIVNYFVSQISDPMIYKDDRVARMSTMLKMLGVCQARMNYLQLFSNKTDEDSFDGMSTRVPAFVENALISAILRPESRLYANSWIQAGKELSHHYDGQILPNANQFELYIPKIDVSTFRSEQSCQAMTPCVGWVIERMLEIVCYVPNMSVEHSSLINFDKRRYVYNLISNVLDLGRRRIVQSNGATEEEPFDHEKRQGILQRLSYIFNPDRKLHVIDRRQIRESALREVKQYPRNFSKNRVFATYVQQEIEKAKRDGRQRDIIDTQGKDHKRVGMHKFKGPMSSGSSTFNGMVGGESSSANSSSASFIERSKGRSRFGGLLKAVRPISMAFTGGLSEKTTSLSNDKVIAVSQLPDISSINDVRCKMMMNIELQQAGNISVMEGGQSILTVTMGGNTYGFQAVDEEDAEEWVNYLNMSKKYAIYKMLVSPSYTKVFGIPLDIVCEREKQKIPRVVETLLGEIEKRGMEELGLYRVSGSVASVNLLKGQFDSGAHVNMEDSRWYDINTVAGCFKLYLRELPEPILTNQLSAEFIECGKAIIDDEASLGPLYSALRKLPEPNFNLLKRLLRHLGAVAALEEKNKMKTPNLAIVFSMSFLPSNGMEYMRATQNLVNSMIVYNEALFRDDPPWGASELELEHEDQKHQHNGEEPPHELLNEPSQRAILEQELQANSEIPSVPPVPPARLFPRRPLPLMEDNNVAADNGLLDQQVQQDQQESEQTGAPPTLADAEPAHSTPYVGEAVTTTGNSIETLQPTVGPVMNNIQSAMAISEDEYQGTADLKEEKEEGEEEKRNRLVGQSTEENLADVSAY